MPANANCGREVLVPRPVRRYSASASRANGHNRLVVVAGAHASGLENPVLGDPVKRLREYFAAIGLEYDALTRAPATRIHRGMEAFGKLHFVVMRIQLRPQIDIALRPAQRLEVTSHVRHIGIAVDHRADHEGGVDDLAIAELLGEIIGAAEQRRSPRPAL